MSRYKYILVLLLGLFLSQAPVYAHDWYAPKCCSSMDCHPIDSCSELSENNDGSYSYGKLTFSKDKVHPSEDNKCHVCIGKYGAFGTIPVDTPLCVYIQEGS